MYYIFRSFTCSHRSPHMKIFSYVTNIQPYQVRQLAPAPKSSFSRSPRPSILIKTVPVEGAIKAWHKFSIFGSCALCLLGLAEQPASARVATERVLQAPSKALQQQWGTALIWQISKVLLKRWQSFHPHMHLVQDRSKGKLTTSRASASALQRCSS